MARRVLHAVLEGLLVAALGTLAVGAGSAVVSAIAAFDAGVWYATGAVAAGVALLRLLRPAKDKATDPEAKAASSAAAPMSREELTRSLGEIRRMLQGTQTAYEPVVPLLQRVADRVHAAAIGFDDAMFREAFLLQADGAFVRQEPLGSRRHSGLQSAHQRLALAQAIQDAFETDPEAVRTLLEAGPAPILIRITHRAEDEEEGQIIPARTSVTFGPRTLPWRARGWGAKNLELSRP